MNMATKQELLLADIAKNMAELNQSQQSYQDERMFLIEEAEKSKRRRKWAIRIAIVGLVGVFGYYVVTPMVSHHVETSPNSELYKYKIELAKAKSKSFIAKLSSREVFDDPAKPYFVGEPLFAFADYDENHVYEVEKLKGKTSDMSFLETVSAYTNAGLSDALGDMEAFIIRRSRNADFDITDDYKPMEYIEKEAHKQHVKDTQKGKSLHIVKMSSQKGKTRVYHMSDGSIVAKVGGHLNWRTNNPGNLQMPHCYKGRFTGCVGADKTYKYKRTQPQAVAKAKRLYKGVVDIDRWGQLVFKTPYHGRLAMAQYLQVKHNNRTFKQMIRKYAKPDYAGTPNYASYERTVFGHADSLGLNIRGKKLKHMTDKERVAMIDGMIKKEGTKVGKNESRGRWD